MYNIDLSLNRVYWEYLQTKTYLRPKYDYLCSQTLPILGCRVTCPEYRNRGNSFKKDLTEIVSRFAKKYSDHKFMIALSGGIDSEVTAETFYQLGIPFTAISLRLFNGDNDFDIIYAAKFCKERNIPHRVIKLSIEKMIDKVFPLAEKHGQFTHSLSQIALTHLFNFANEDTILIFSGHNPDVLPNMGWGWWEGSPNLVKYAISTHKKFFTFTSLEPIFLHYANNWDRAQPGEKDNTFLYEEFPNLTPRIKRTGWEKLQPTMDRLSIIYRKKSRHPHQTFITWDSTIQRVINNYKKEFRHKIGKKEWDDYENLIKNMKMRNV